MAISDYYKEVQIMDNFILITTSTLTRRLRMRSATIERILGLPIKSLSDSRFVKLPETQALLRIVYVYPWLLEVCEHKFDKEKADLILIREYAKTRLEEL